VSKILIADDDFDIVEMISDSLEDEGYECIKITDSRMVINSIQEYPEISLFILDIMMPDINGLEICREIRPLTDAPIIFLSAKAREIDKIIGLEIGADDYLVKPFSTDELIARVKAHLRREKRVLKKSATEIETANDTNAYWRYFGDFKFNPMTYDLFCDNKKIELSTKEFQLLSFMFDNENRVLTRQQIYEGVWGYNEYGDINTVTVHIKNLRTKLNDDNRHLITIWGVGYKFVK